MSKRLAMFLFEQHTGAISPGLLCVMEVTSGGRRGLALLKLERERVAELKFHKKDGKRIVDMSVIDDLILTDGQWQIAGKVARVLDPVGPKSAVTEVKGSELIQ